MNPSKGKSAYKIILPPPLPLGSSLYPPFPLGSSLYPPPFPWGQALELRLASWCTNHHVTGVIG